jgi:hypothetical protein
MTTARLGKLVSRQWARDHYGYSSIEDLEPTTIMNNHQYHPVRTDINPKTIHTSVIENLSSEDFTEVERSLKWKLDVRLLACLWLMFILNFLDRVCLYPLRAYRLRLTITW